jgi:hypothetical protein
MEFMITEGDRAGVEIPSHAEKAANVIHALIKKLEGMDLYTLKDLNDAENDIRRAKLHLYMHNEP